AQRPRRRLLFLRVNQTWSHVLENVPRWRLRELDGSAPLPPEHAAAAEIEAFLDEAGVDLSLASAAYDALGGDGGAQRMNEVATSFTALAPADVDALAQHARWQA